MIARIHATASASRANGPGRRFVVWFQGCTLGCAGCFNPATHAAAGPTIALDEVIAAFDAALPVRDADPVQILARVLDVRSPQ